MLVSFKAWVWPGDWAWPGAPARNAAKASVVHMDSRPSRGKKGSIMPDAKPCDLEELLCLFPGRSARANGGLGAPCLRERADRPCQQVRHLGAEGFAQKKVSGTLQAEINAGVVS